MREPSDKQMQTALDYYRSQHRTTGCKITHMFGVPLLLLSLPVFCLHRRAGIWMFAAGVLLQLSGHYLFERNKPIFMGQPRNLLNYTSALAFVTDEWRGALHDWIVFLRAIGRKKTEIVQIEPGSRAA